MITQQQLLAAIDSAIAPYIRKIYSGKTIGGPAGAKTTVTLDVPLLDTNWVTAECWGDLAPGETVAVMEAEIPGQEMKRFAVGTAAMGVSRENRTRVYRSFPTQQPPAQANIKALVLFSEYNFNRSHYWICGDRKTPELLFSVDTIYVEGFLENLGLGKQQYFLCIKYGYQEYVYNSQTVWRYTNMVFRVNGRAYTFEHPTIPPESVFGVSYRPREFWESYDPFFLFYDKHPATHPEFFDRTSGSLATYFQQDTAYWHRGLGNFAFAGQGGGGVNLIGNKGYWVFGGGFEVYGAGPEAIIEPPWDASPAKESLHVAELTYNENHQSSAAVILTTFPEWNAGNVYQPDDIVTREGDHFYAIRENVGLDPNDYFYDWRIIRWPSYVIITDRFGFKVYTFGVTDWNPDLAYESGQIVRQKLPGFQDIDGERYHSYYLALEPNQNSNPLTSSVWSEAGRFRVYTSFYSKDYHAVKLPSS